MYAMEVFFHKEEATFLNLLRIRAKPFTYQNPLTPGCVAAMQRQVTECQLPAVQAVMAISLLQDMQSGAGFTSGNVGGFFDPVSRLELVMTGRLGTLLGTNLITDGFRNSRLRILTNDEIFMLAPAEHIGAIVDYGGVKIAERLPEDEGKVGFRLEYKADLIFYNRPETTVVLGHRESSKQGKERIQRERAEKMFETYVTQAGTRPVHGEEKLVAKTQRGHIYVRDNGVGGRTYLSDAVGVGGVVVWDTTLVTEDELKTAIACNFDVEARLKRVEEFTEANKAMLLAGEQPKPLTFEGALTLIKAQNLMRREAWPAGGYVFVRGSGVLAGLMRMSQWPNSPPDSPATYLEPWEPTSDDLLAKDWVMNMNKAEWNKVYGA